MIKAARESSRAAEANRACEGDAATVIDSNKNPEQLARDQIDALLTEAGWAVQDKKAINFNAGQGIAVREYLSFPKIISARTDDAVRTEWAWR